MATRRDFYFKQPVQENEMDEAFDDLESADRNQNIDLGLTAIDVDANDGGIMKGLKPPAGPTLPSLSVQFTQGAAYDNLGRRVATSGALTLDCSLTGITAIGAAGTPAGGAATVPSGGNQRWLSVYIGFDRLLSDSRTDGTGATIQYDQVESFTFEVDVGAEAVTATAKVPLKTGKLLLTDLLIDDASTVLEINSDRRQVWLRAATGGAPTTRAGTPGTFATRGLEEDTGVRDAIKQILGYYNDHVDGTDDKHSGSALTYNGGPAWADGTTLNPATTVELQLDKIITDLGETSTHLGANKISSVATSTGGVDDTSNGTLQAAIAELMGFINDRLELSASAGQQIVAEGVRFNIVSNAVEMITTTDQNAINVAAGALNQSGKPVDVATFTGADNAHATGASGSGIQATGGETTAGSGVGGVGVETIGGDSATGIAGAGVVAQGGAGGGAGQGGSAIIAVGGESVSGAAGYGVTAQGGTGQSAIKGEGIGTNAKGGEFIGAASAEGVHGTGGSTSAGVLGIGGSNGHGLQGTGTGVGDGTRSTAGDDATSWAGRFEQSTGSKLGGGIKVVGGDNRLAAQIDADGTGNGVQGRGGETGLTIGVYGLSGAGTATGFGVYGTGGAGGGHGVKGVGVTAGTGVIGEGAGAAYGVTGTGGATGDGVLGVGGSTGGRGGYFTGTGGSDGIAGIGGPTNGNGGYFAGDGTGDGVQIAGVGSEIGLNVVGTTSGNGIECAVTTGHGIDVDATSGNAVDAVATSGHSVHSSVSTGVGIHSTATGTGTAGFFNGGATGVSISASFATVRGNIYLASGGTPTTPLDGDVWFDGSELHMRIGGDSYTFDKTVV